MDFNKVRTVFNTLGERILYTRGFAMAVDVFFPEPTLGKWTIVSHDVARACGGGDPHPRGLRLTSPRAARPLGLALSSAEVRDGRSREGIYGRARLRTVAPVTEKELRKKVRDLERKYERHYESMRLRGKTAEAYEKLRKLGAQLDEAQKALDDFLTAQGRKTP